MLSRRVRSYLQCKLVLRLAATLFLAGVTATRGYAGLWAADRFTHDLLTINPLTGLETQVATLVKDSAPSTPTVAGLAFDPNSSTLYGVSATAGQYVLHRIVPGQGAPNAFRVGTGLGFVVEGLAFDSNTNTLYGSDISSDVLVTINTSTGLATQVGSGLGFDIVVGLAFDPNTNILYGTDAAADALLTIDTVTGVATKVGSALGFSGVASLAFDHTTDTLYGVDVFQDLLLSIDTTTGIATSVGSRLGSGQVEGLAFQVLPGDYNGNGVVDTADYSRWRDNAGAAAGTLVNDIDGGAIGAAQYATWKANIGATLIPNAASLATAAVPEPPTIGLAFLVWLAAIAFNRYWHSSLTS